MIFAQRAAAIGALVLFSQCASREAPIHTIESHDTARDAAVAENLASDPVLEKMSAARELSILRNVDRVTLSRDALIEKVREHIERAVPRAEIAREEAFLKATGAIAITDDYEKSVYDSLYFALAGMYEPFDKKMYVREDARDEDLTIAHESVHALQDQHFDLSAWEKYLPGASDEMLARACLAEGDAAVAAGESPRAPSDKWGVSPYVEREIAAPYVAGVAFVRALRERGGWDEVNRAWTRGLTTQQILHPEKYFSNVRPDRIPKPTIAALGSEFTATYDVHGELAWSLVLESHAQHASLATGWVGDCSVVARAGDRVAVAWRVRVDTEERATQSSVGRFGECEEGVGSASRSVVQRGREILFLSAPAPCSTIKRWAKEIFEN